LFIRQGQFWTLIHFISRADVRANFKDVLYMYLKSEVHQFIVAKSRSIMEVISKIVSFPRESKNIVVVTLN
jgi:hypothetical protein